MSFIKGGGIATHGFVEAADTMHIDGASPSLHKYICASLGGGPSSPELKAVLVDAAVSDAGQGLLTTDWGQRQPLPPLPALEVKSDDGNWFQIPVKEGFAHRPNLECNL